MLSAWNKSRSNEFARGQVRHPSAGFTLIELLIAMAIIGILASIALPAYSNYVLRGRVAEATNLLASAQTQMEQYYQDNRTYASYTNSQGSTVSPPCLTAQYTQGNYFKISCTSSSLSASGYSITAVGTTGTNVSGFTYSIDQARNMATTSSKWGTSTRCWLTRPSQDATKC